jgi:hypothetical protein
MFFMLVKGTMYLLHVFPPIISAISHAALIGLYTVSVYYQGSSDNTDPDCKSNGPVWYITKSCSVTRNKSLVGYCKQAKATFALTVSILGLFVIYFGIAIWSCFPSKIQKAEYYERKHARENKWAALEAEHEAAVREGRIEGMMPETPGPQTGLNPMTPRTMAFNTLGGTKNVQRENKPKDLPLRNHFSSPRPTSPTYNLRSPGLQRSPLSMGFGGKKNEPAQSEVEVQEEPAQPTMYFAPPPKKAEKPGKKK